MNNEYYHLALGLSFVARVCTKVMIARVSASCYNQWEMASNLTKHDTEKAKTNYLLKSTIQNKYKHPKVV